MCMNNPVRIESKDVPKYAYKLYESCLGENVLLTLYYKQEHIIGKFNKAITRKKSYDTIKHYPTAMHQGRISVFVNLSDAMRYMANTYSSGSVKCWKVEIKQTTKHAYNGNVGYVNRKPTLAVDKVKPIEQVI